MGVYHMEFGSSGSSFMERAAAEEAAKYEPGDMLDDMNDPLAVNARPAKKPVAAPPPPPVFQPPLPPKPTPAADLAETQDPKLSALLQKDADYNAAFKREVERMVQEKMLAESLERNKTPAISAAALAAAEEAAPKLVTVPKDTFADAAALLASVNLPQYAAQFEEEAMDPGTLIEVLDQQGKPALDEVRRPRIAHSATAAAHDPCH